MQWTPCVNKHYLFIQGLSLFSIECSRSLFFFILMGEGGGRGSISPKGFATHGLPHTFPLPPPSRRPPRPGPLILKILRGCFSFLECAPRSPFTFPRRVPLTLYFPPPTCLCYLRLLLSFRTIRGRKKQEQIKYEREREKQEQHLLSKHERTGRRRELYLC